MTCAKPLSCHLVSIAALCGCSGLVYPVGEQEHAAGGDSTSGGSSAAGGAYPVDSGGTAAVGGSSYGMGGSNPSTGGASSSLATASTTAVGGSSANTGGMASNGGSSLSTGGNATSIGGTTDTGGSGAGNAPTGGNANTGGKAANSGGTVASSGGTSASTGGSSAAGGIHSRVAIIDPDSNRFEAYDSEGQLVHDYMALLEFDASLQDRIICLEGAALSWDGRASTPFFSVVTTAGPGKYSPMAASEIFVRASRVGSGSVNLRIANASGAVSDEFAIAGNWEVFESSPLRQYVLGGTQGQTGILVRRSTHAVVWQGALSQAAFSPDDQHLLVVDASGSTALTLIETSSGRTSPVRVNILPGTFSMGAAIVNGALNSGALVSISRSNNAGQALFWVGWDGSIKPLDASLPGDVDEYVLRSNSDDSRVAWWRNQHSPSIPVDASLLGWFELEIANTTSQPLPALQDTSRDCYASTTSVYYKLYTGAIWACDCGAPLCASFAEVPSPEDPGWLSTVSVSPQGGIVGHNYDWPLDRMPQSTPKASLYDAHGISFAKVDAGWFEYDRLDQLVLATLSEPLTSGTVIVSASTGTVTPIDGRYRAIMYEQ